MTGRLLHLTFCPHTTRTQGSKGSGYGFVRYAVYQVASGPYAGKTILAYEGTFSSDQKWQVRPIHSLGSGQNVRMEAAA